MNPEIVNRLLEINRTFYTAFARSFADSRPPDQPGFWRLLPYIPAGGRLLDVGCGDGRIARWLEAVERPVAYWGLDFSPAMVALARRRCRTLRRVQTTFRVADVAEPGWADDLPLASFDVVLALALLHHLPGFALRARFLGRVAALLKPGGICGLSTWQFLRAERLRRRIVPWSAVGLSPEVLEPGDYLLDWRRDGYGYRYVHLVDEAEMARLIRAAGLVQVEAFDADGREGNLSRYVVLIRPPSPEPPEGALPPAEQPP
ncbi:MAG: class I SAM-dependent methyltransferase [Chloroflexi bacterium]|nr:MAG: class I SAM-dependent methyltransferase [Chloroflexota bacterium]